MSKPVRNISSALLVFLLVCCAYPLRAQDIVKTNWYFGGSENNLLFDKSGRDVELETRKAIPFSMEGSVVINDQFTGNLLFYTDGRTIYDATHRALPSIQAGSELAADTSFNQPVVVAPNPTNNNQYYLFTNATSELQVTTIDASLPGNSTVAQFPLGEVDTYNAPTGIGPQSEGMIVLAADDGERYYLISQDPVDYYFNILEITAAGFATDTLHVIPNILPGFEVVQMAYNRDSLQLALAPKERNRNIMIFDVNLDSGRLLTFNRQLLNTAVTDSSSTAIYDVEWSNDGTKLYFSVMGNQTRNGDLLQVDFADTVNVPLPVNSILSFSPFRSYGLERGIDDRIYHLYQLTAGGPHTLARLDQPDSTDMAIGYDSTVFDVDFQSRQFPQFTAPNMPAFTNITFTYRDSCQAETTKFFPQVTPEPNNYLWDLGDGTLSTAVSPIHTYQNPGPYFVTLITELNGRFGFRSAPVEIFQSDTTLNLGNDTTICVDEILQLDAGQALQYLWNTGETSQMIQVDTAGTYWVEVITSTGCTSYDEIIVTEYGTSQQQGAIWYFGERAGLDFRGGAPVALADNNVMTSPEGCASISDINGELIFYTNGSTVWNKEDSVMLNGNNIGGDSTSTQSALIIPFQNDNTMFYIFTTEQVYGDFSYTLSYSIVDMKYDQARGKVILKDYPLVTNSTERVTASGFTGSPYLLTHEYGNSHFRSYLLSNSGIGPANHSGVGEPNSFFNQLEAGGYFKFAPSGNHVAMLIPGDTNYVEISNFDFGTGAVSNPRLIDIEEYAPARAYGLEYSGDGFKLYISTDGAGSKLIQYDLDSINSMDPVADISATKYDAYGTTQSGYGALQRGSNGVIYLAIENQTQIGSINSPGGDDDLAGFQEAAIDINPDGSGRLSRRGLPNFTLQANNQFLQPGITTSVGCLGLPTQFSGQGRDNSIEEYTWDFGDGFGASGQNVTHTYTATGSYFVSLTLTNRCDTALVLQDTLEVFSIPEQPLVNDTTLCEGQVTLAAWDEDRDDLRYYWSTGDTTRTITLTSDLFQNLNVLPIDVAIITTDGCSSDTLSIAVSDGFGIINLGEPRILCQNDSVQILDSGVPGPNWNWYSNNTLIGNEQTQAIDTSVPGSFIYRVDVFNDVTGCLESDSVQITISEQPGLQQSNVVEPDCGTANGEFELEINTSGNFTYQLDGPVSSGPFVFDGPGNPTPFTGLSAGSYIATVTNNITGCQNNEVFLLEDDAPFEMDAVALNDCFSTGDIQVNIQNLVGSRVDIEVLDADGQSVYSSLAEPISRGVMISDLDTGLYFVQVTDVNPPNCIQSDSVRLNIVNECFRVINAPNAFTPYNNDGLNDTWSIIPNDFIETFEIIIYNRWGRSIFYSNDPNFSWDGNFENKPVGPGAFAYKIVFSSQLEPEVGLIEQFGSVTVIR